MNSNLSREYIMSWRKLERRRLIENRVAIDAATRQKHADDIAAKLSNLIGNFPGRIISAYWPFRGEPDLRRWMENLPDLGRSCALPVVVEKNAPMKFRIWRKGDKLAPGVWNIPVPAGGDDVTPDVVIAPLVGFDTACYRLGYGGGYFDRTIASTSPRPLVIGVGYAGSFIETINPLPHDIPMDLIVTDHEVYSPLTRSTSDHDMP